MNTQINKINEIVSDNNIAYLISNVDALEGTLLTEKERLYVKKQNLDNKKEIVVINRLDQIIFIQFLKKDIDGYKQKEYCRKSGDTLLSIVKDHEIEDVVIACELGKEEFLLAFCEGIALGNYQFLKYKKDEAKKTSLKRISVFSDSVAKKDIDELNIIIDAVFRCRNMVNEPVAYMNADKFASEVEEMGKDCGAKVEVFNKRKIEALKMGGLLAVNKGSVDPPTFTIIEWNPENAVNKKPFVLVGKGVVYDTGGMNIKTGNYMDGMKADMAGAAAVASAIYAIAKAELPVYVVGLLPATDNRPNGNAYVPGDIINMFRF